MLNFAQVMDIDQELQTSDDNSSCLLQANSYSLTNPPSTTILLNSATAEVVPHKIQGNSSMRETPISRDSSLASLATAKQVLGHLGQVTRQFAKPSLASAISMVYQILLLAA